MRPGAPTPSPAGGVPAEQAGPSLDPRVQRSRRAVLVAALELMVERGVFATTVDAVAERSGVAKSTIYRQWANRHALLADAWAEIPPPDLPPLRGELEADLVAVVAAINHRLGTPPMSVLLPDLLAATERDPAFGELHDRLLRARRRPLLGLVNDAVAAGGLPAGTDAELLVSLLLGPMLYQRVIVQQPAGEAFVEQVVRSVLAAARAGLVGLAPRPEHESSTRGFPQHIVGEAAPAEGAVD